MTRTPHPPRPVRRVTLDQVRALTAGGPRSVLILNPAGDELQLVDPNTAGRLVINDGARVLCTRTDVRETAAAYRAAGRVRDAVAAAVAAIARDLTGLLSGTAQVAGVRR